MLLIAPFYYCHSGDHKTDEIITEEKTNDQKKEFSQIMEEKEKYNRLYMQWNLSYRDFFYCPLYTIIIGDSTVCSYYYSYYCSKAMHILFSTSC